LDSYIFKSYTLAKFDFTTHKLQSSASRDDTPPGRNLGTCSAEYQFFYYMSTTAFLFTGLVHRMGWHQPQKASYSLRHWITPISVKYRLILLHIDVIQVGIRKYLELTFCVSVTVGFWQ
jgi:hypothetical protein